LIFSKTILSLSVLSSCQSSKNTITNANKPQENFLVEGEFSILDSDNLGNIYLVNEDNELLQYNSNYKLLYKFSVNTLGDIGSIDVSNPQKILVYYPDFQFIVFVDNTLSEIKRLNLERMNFWDVQGVALSNDNLIWIYDPVNYRLLKIDEAGNIKISSKQIFAEKSSVYLYTNSELMIFDLFGQLIKEMKIENEKLQFLDTQLMILNDNELRLKDLLLTSFEQSNDGFYSNKNLKVIDFTILEKDLFLLIEGGLIKK